MRSDEERPTDTMKSQTFFNALCGDNSSNQWKTCSYDHPPDYVGVHAYETTVDAMKGKVESYHSTFAKPIVLSEFACKVSVRNLWWPMSY